MDKEKVEWIIENFEILVSMLKEELLNVKEKENSFEIFHPIDNDDDIEYYEED